MFENPNLDRYLERAQMFLDREDYTAAVHLLQRGHTGEKVYDVNRALRLNDRHDREVLLLLDPAVIAQSPALSS